MSSIPWKVYYEKARKFGPSPFLEMALKSVTNREKAIDIGAGSMVDTDLLIDAGFKEVVVLDNNPNVAELAKEERYKSVILDGRNVEQYDYQQNTFDIVYASKVLHFIKQEEYESVVASILSSIKPGGLFVGALVGDKSDMTRNISMTFMSFEQHKQFFMRDGWKILTATNKDDGAGLHIIGIIAKKND
ncbi:MAG: hypothetical protein RL094_498 [Candidatus Parcubacteria bacterium]|jgi:trans-aconitate methyltransferase